MDVRAAFAKYDRAKTGYIAPSDLNLAMAAIGEPVNDPMDIATLQSEHVDNDGRVYYRDFIKSLIIK
jgi:Ca2+-binding EF-hand superfamily protein